MWKWFTALLLLTILLTPTPVLADSSEDVTVTATGYIVDAPGGFTLTYISDYEVGISWTKPLMWVSPDGFNDPDSVWTDEPNAYDGDLDTYAVTTLPNWLELIPSSPVVCDKIRINAARWKSFPTPEYVDGYGRVEAYYDADWHEVFDGTFPSRQWLEISLGALKTVEKARVCLTVGWSNLRVFEFEFLDSAKSAENTMVRAAVGRVPESRTDGYLVYYGDGTSTSDTGVSLDESAEVYYRAWSQNVSGAWEEVGTSDFIGGYGMLAIAMSIIILGLTVLAFVRKEGMLYAVSIVAWLFFTLFMFNQNWPAENTYLPTAIALFGASMVIVCVVMLLNHYIYSRRTSPPTHSEIQLAHRKKVLSITHRRKRQWWEE